MKKRYLFLITCIFSMGLFAQKNGVVDEFQLYDKDTSLTIKKAGPEAAEDWKDQRFGMFIHWGPIYEIFFDGLNVRKGSMLEHLINRGHCSD